MTPRGGQSAAHFGSQSSQYSASASYGQSTFNPQQSEIPNELPEQWHIPGACVVVLPNGEEVGNLQGLVSVLMEKQGMHHFGSQRFLHSGAVEWRETRCAKDVDGTSSACDEQGHFGVGWLEICFVFVFFLCVYSEAKPTTGPYTGSCGLLTSIDKGGHALVKFASNYSLIPVNLICASGFKK